jgi:hypothetical protein
MPNSHLFCTFDLPHRLRFTKLQEGQPFSLITNMTVLHQPGNVHSRWRGPEYIEQYDRFFFQWWNFLVYDAETHDHWTVVYHTTKFSQAANYSDYASTAMIHKTGAKHVVSSHQAVPLKDLIHEKDWDLKMRMPDGSTPHRVTIIDDDTYNVIADLPASASDNRHSPVRWNLTFHRVHGMYSSLDAEEGNKPNCAVASTLFGYHSKVSGWISEGEKRWEFGTEGAAGKRYRAYAAGSWGCKLPAGFPHFEYPWTWMWLTIPGDPAANPPREEIGMSMGTARFQLNNSLTGDLYGGFASVGVGKDITTATFASLHHNTSWEIPVSKASTDEFLKIYNNPLSGWTKITDDAGEFEVPLQQIYEIETAHHRFHLTFHTRPEQYFRLPVVVEHIEPGSNKKLAVFSDFRACGVEVDVKIWSRSKSPAEQTSARGGSRKKTMLGVPKGTDPLWTEGGWEKVIYDGRVDSLNAIEFAYQAPMAEDIFEQFLAPQRFAGK